MLSFDPTITMGNIITLLGMGAGVITLCWKVNQWVTSAVASNTSDHDRFTKRLDHVDLCIDDIHDRFDAMHPASKGSRRRREP